ncbi:MAG: MBL fold metallo-hydrolase [Syntrophales bacterium]|nr:MBL fold metallo-hydrolase [Syntrophales bacterium]
MIVKQMQVGSMVVFAYLLGDEETGEALVIDPASNVHSIVKEAENNNLDIRYIVNTHGHVDHIGGNAEMKEATGAQIIIHEGDAGMLASTPAMMLRMFGGSASPPADITVRDGDTISVGSINLKVLHTPGHSPGGMCLYVPGYVFTGDTLFVEAVGRSDLPGGSWPVMLRSIQERLLTLPEDTVVLPGHNYGRSATSTIGHEKANNPFLRG